MNKYQIIKDINILQEFIDWLPELLPNEKFYISLLARKKYDSRLKSDKSLIQRFVCDKSRMLEKIQRLELEEGAYKSNGLDVLNESLALYIHINPRDLKLATYKSLKEFTDTLQKDSNYDIYNQVLNCIQVSKSNAHYISFDIDSKDFDFTQLEGLVNKECLHIIETRGGYHIHVKLEDLSNDYKKSYYNNLSQLSDQRGDLLSPIPGCTQGGFIPHFISI
jgi:hypothetical protein